jgi:hypothetical protein
MLSDDTYRGYPNCQHCRNALISGHGTLPSTIARSCPLCRLLSASISLARASLVDELHSFSLRFHRLILSHDVFEDGSGSGSFQMRHAEQDFSVKTTPTSRQLKSPGFGAVQTEQGPVVKITSYPHRKLTVHARLPVGAAEDRLGLATGMSCL